MPAIPPRFRASTLIPLAASCLVSGWVLAAEGGGDLPPGLPAATRGPVAVAFTPDGARALVVESDAAALAVVDAADGRVRREIPTGGVRPSAVAADTGRTALVANAFSGSVARVDLETGARLAEVPLPGEPSGIVIAPDGKRAFVSVAQLDQVAVLELPSLAVRARVAVGSRPRAMALAPDGRTLVVANFRGGDLSLVDTDALRAARRIPLRGVNLRGLCLTSDGQTAYVSGQVPAQNRVTWVARDVWVNTLFQVDLRTGASAPVSEARIDLSGGPAPDPDGLALLPDGRLAVNASGSDQTLLVRLAEGGGAYLSPTIERRQRVGAHPRGLALSPDRTQLWAANELDGSVSVLEAGTLQPVRRIDLGCPENPDASLPGRYLFGSAKLTAGGQFTCNSCHPEGGVDGQTWAFVHVPDDVPARNTRNLRGGVTHTAPFRWSGRETDLSLFLQDEITRLMHGRAQPPAALQAIGGMLERLPMPPNPNRKPDGALTEAAERGKLLFEGRAGCVTCHSGERRGGTGLKADLGTLLGRSLDVPHLVGVHDTAPYLHDGRARTLEEIFTRWNPDRKHGKADQLSAEEIADLLRYVREL
jgi:DNA-binding beta-propeller fold protein YncE/mono/diheme cytochrome c family protein